jgi:regulator of replication initiation timing
MNKYSFDTTSSIQDQLTNFRQELGNHKHSGFEAINSGGTNACPICLSLENKSLSAENKKLKEVLTKILEQHFSYPNLSHSERETTDIIKKALE